jgi:hypothetical protein
MKKIEKDFLKQMDSIISTAFITENDQKMLEFTKHFMNKLQMIDLDGIKIQIEPMDVKLFQYFILSVIVEWENKYRKSVN